MNEPDKDLRATFQRWRQQEAAEAPVFSPPRVTVRRRFPVLRIAAAALATSLIAVALLRLALPDQRTTTVTLADAIPGPLLAPPLPGGFALTAPAPLLPVTSASNFLLPISTSIHSFP
jgi:hypothetical protein